MGILQTSGQTYQSGSRRFEIMDDNTAWAPGLRQRRGNRELDERQRRTTRGVDRSSSSNNDDENEQSNNDESKDEEAENDHDVGNDDRSPITPRHPRQSRNTTTNQHSPNTNSRAIRDNISRFPPGSARPAANMARLASFVSDGAAAVVTVLAGPNSPLPPGPQEGFGRLMSGLGGVAGGGGTMVAAGYGGGGTVGGVGGGGGGNGGGGGFVTPYKGPFKGENGLVETPSSITTAGQTADSTTLATQSPLNVRRLNSQRRRRGSMNDTSNTTTLQRQYRILRSQIILLLGSSAMGLLLFLFYALPLAAFASLIFFVLSLGALLPVFSQMAMAQYQLEMQHPLGLVRHLPDSLRIMLTETTLHEFMADTTFFMEYRYLLLYFIPGLRQEQLMEYIDRLPSRHREALLQRGLGRFMPSVMESLMRIDENDEGVEYELVDEDNNANSGDGELSVASGLTIDREHMLAEVNGEYDYDDENVNDDDAPVTLFETIGGLRRTIVDFARGNGSQDDDIVSNPTLPTTETSPTFYSANATPTNEENRDDEEDYDASFEFSLDISTTGLTNIVQEGATTAVAATSVRGVVMTSSNDNFDVQNVIVGPQSPDSESNEAINEQVQQEYDLEGIILAEATSAATAYYASQATAVAVDAATEAVVTTSSWIIRTGSWTGIIAGGGGIVASILADYSFLSLGFGSVNTISLGFINNVERENHNSSNSTISERRSSYIPVVYGFFATSAFGFIGAGVAYLVRNRARAVIASKREEQALIDILSKEDEAGDA